MSKVTFRLLLLSFVFAAGCAMKAKNESKEAKVYTESVIPLDAKQALRAKRILCPSPRDKKWKADDWKTLVKRANSCVRKKDWPMVETVGNYLATRDHLAPWGSYYLSVAAGAANDYPKALWMIELALRKAPRNGLLHYQKGRLLWGVGDNEKSVEQISMAVKLEPTLSGAHTFLAKVYFRDQDLSLARKHYEIVLKQQPRNVDVLVGIAEVYRLKKDGPKAREYLSKAIFQDPDNLSYHLRMAYIYENIDKDFVSALNIYRKIRENVKVRKFKGKVGFDLNEKIKTLEVTVRSMAPGEKVTYRTPAEEKGVAK